MRASYTLFKMATRTKTVCVIGSGPSGLVAAKTLTHDYPKGTFDVTVFEQSHRIGGLWPISHDDDGLVNPDMCTNQSRHTVSFSDLAWPASSLACPKAWQVGKYLEDYVKMYPGYSVKTGVRVFKVEPPSGWQTNPATTEKWNVHVQHYESAEFTGSPQVYEFDHVIVATGFFGKPKIPEILTGLSAPVWHSSKLRDVNSLLTDNGKLSSSKGKNIVVVGGQMSGIETAAAVALQVSSSVNSSERPIPNANEYKIYNVVQQPFWVMTLTLPTNPIIDSASPEEEKIPNPAPTFLPLDLITYNIERKPPGPLKNSSGHISPEVAKMTNDFMANYLGTDQSGIGTDHLAITGHVRSEPPRLTASENYVEFVRSGDIKTIRGKLTSADPNQPNAIIIEDDGAQQIIDDVAAVILATGFDTSRSLNFLPKEILQHLSFDESSSEFPLALNVHSTISAKIPSLGFVGFYRSPYWGVMEMQARFLGKLWSGGAQAQKTLETDDTINKLLELRTDPRIAQFPMGDYAYLMESFATAVGIQRQEPTNDPEARTGIVLPSRYLYTHASDAQKEQAALALSIVNSTFDSSSCGAFVSKAIFRSLQGTWKLLRSLKSSLSTFPSGTFTGTAKFLPRFPTAPSFDSEYLYIEEGDFVTDTGMTFRASRRYVYRYREDTDTLTLWFVKTDDNLGVDYLFHEMEILVPEAGKEVEGQGKKSMGWRAKSSHLCIADTYDVEYEFRFKGVNVEEWKQEYSVKGPNKDYRIRNDYRR
ncbi:5993d270-f887-46f7-a901-d9cc355e06dd [Sclerotinia trifoliorum]|uniref:5993d270-f887-46f7-a901-d9cc355e06dd n=1 Tax=Sclerotinia trifoliorum TaxID=28548 RepID=A0A8H2ZPP2_9HELO|nr:5993d270-f887-46f7-a901-d9cc355e06dd [Sclerotinia trifoliorum]